MSMEVLSDVVVPIVVASVVVPFAYQFFNAMANRIAESNHNGILARKASMLQAQINDNTAINNTAISGVAGQEEVSKTAKSS